MRIIKQGNTGPVKLITSCNTCGCIVEIDKSEVKTVPKINPLTMKYAIMIPCPTKGCGQEIEAAENR